MNLMMNMKIVSVGATNLFEKKMYDKISLYIPPRRPLEDVIGQLRNEFEMLNNMKDDEARWNIQETIFKIIGLLRQAIRDKHKLPNGLIIFADIHGMETIEPLKFTVDINLYRCDDHFDREQLEHNYRKNAK